VFAKDLDPDRETSFRLTAWDAHAADSCEGGGDRVDVFEVHLQRVVGLFAEFEGGCRSDGADQRVDLREGSEKVACQQSADLLCLAVVRVIVASGQNVGAE
jgi:hypothetical protein